jgi:hypothetical protein
MPRRETASEEIVGKKTEALEARVTTLEEQVEELLADLRRRYREDTETEDQPAEPLSQ